jgi:polyhydroxybutyrate depolymerase
MTTLLTVCVLLSGTLAGETHREWDLGGVQREAVICLPSQKSDKAPVVFVFHGHGGRARAAARSFNYQKHWPEAIVVYMQGLPTPGTNDPDGKKPGWQKTVGDQEDRDLKFFDAVLATLKQEQAIDDDRIYATGHSNGGGFTYLLWAARGDQFAAFAPSSCGGGRLLNNTPPKPVFHVAGEKDPIAPFEFQKQSLELVKKNNGCEAEGKPFDNGCTLYASPHDAPVVTFIHPGDHKFPDRAVPLIVRFFQQHPRTPVARK